MISRKPLAHGVGILAIAGLAVAPGVNAAPGDPAEAARSYLQQHKQELGLTGTDINDVVVSSIVPSAQSRLTHVYLQQRYRGIEV